VVALAAGCAGGSLIITHKSPSTPVGTTHTVPAADTRSATTLLRLGIAQAQLRHFQQADTTFHDLLAIDPTNKYAWYDLALIAQETNRASAALADYAKAISIDPRYTPAMFNEAILLERASPRAALSIYRRITSINPRAATAFLREGWVYDRLGNRARGAQDHARAVALDATLAAVPAPRSGERRPGPRLLLRRRPTPMNQPPRVSVFTVSHHPRFLDECLESLMAQTFTDWEWVVLLNAGARWRPPIDDPRLQVIVDDSIDGVGAAKHRVCAELRGELFVELDHDDILASTALAEITRAFDAHPDAALVYSHTAQILEDGSRDDSRYDIRNGWEYHEASVDGRSVQYPRSLLPTPHNVSYIWFAPNHVRAYAGAAYDRTGGYDPTRRVLDDQDLMCRLYQAGEFHLIDAVVYLQRMHSRNTQREPDTNAFIQSETIALYDRYLEGNALAWAGREGLLALDLGAGAEHRPEYLGVDQYPGEGVDIVASLPDRLPLDDDSVGVIRAVDFLGHVADKVALINELYRVLAPGGLLLSNTPSSDGRGAFQDPTHVAFYNENSFWYYTDARYRSFVPQITAAFQVSRLVTYFPTEWHEENRIPYVAANLIALKEPMARNGGLITI
jgi:tetratricopeptide (TPR) repeat protein/SAM-dependent methyltransferase